MKKLSSKKIGIYIHVWVENTWIEITTEILNTIFKYVADRSDIIDINLCFTKECDITELPKHKKIKYIYLNDHYNYESPTLNFLHNTCSNYTTVVYLHTKGCSEPNNLIKINWRQFMLDSMFRFFDIHLTAIDKGYDVSGSLYRHHQFLEIKNNININKYNTKTIGQHYSGNYWIANSRYICKLQNIYDFKQDIQFGKKDSLGFAKNRFADECWILSDPDVKVFNINKKRKFFWECLSEKEILERIEDPIIP